MVRFFLSVFLLFAYCFAADKKVEKLPLLGPGADVLSSDEYIKIYRSYIQQSVLLGYSIGMESANPCDQALQTMFRQAGLFTYPVPTSFERAERHKFQSQGFIIESYLHGGQLLQVERTSKEANLTRMIWVNSAAPKAMRFLWPIAKKGFLKLEQDPKTGLERLSNVPVGYPHPYLDINSQGLFVRQLMFNARKDTCSPVAYNDNSWNYGFVLDNQRCGALRVDLENVWAGKLQAGDLAEKEKSYLKDIAIKNAMERGLSREAAEQLVAKTLVPPFDHDVNVVGGAMRNLGQCNLLAIGRQVSSSAGEEKTKPSDSSGRAGTAK